MDQQPAAAAHVDALLVSLSYLDDAAKIERLASLSAEDWQQAAALARRHEVGPLFYYRLRSLPLNLPAELLGRLKQQYRLNGQRNLILYQSLSKLLRRLQQKEVRVIPLKGAYLAEMVYPDLGLRSMVDVDLLAKEEDLAGIHEDLIALGYVSEDVQRFVGETNHHFGYRRAEANLRLELHWVLAQQGPLREETPELWRRAHPVKLAQSPAWALAREDLLLYICWHAVKHTYEFQLKSLCDLGELLRCQGQDLDWQVIGQRARQLGILRPLYMLLRLVQDWLALPVEQLPALRPDDFDECYLDLLSEQIFAVRAGMNHIQKVDGLLQAPGLAGKLAHLMATLFPSREYMAFRYPAPANSWRIYLYYPVRWRYLLREHGARLGRLLRGDSQARAAAERTNQITSLREWLMSG